MFLSGRGGLVAFAFLVILQTPVSAWWRLPCAAPLVVERADPIVSPGKPSGHVHTIMGGNGFGFDMTYSDTQAATCSSCKVTQDFSNYWVPKLYYKAKNGTFIDVPQSGGALVYYLARVDTRDPEYSEGLVAFPEGFRMLAGNPNLRNYADVLEQQAASYACLGISGPETHDFPKQPCPLGIRSQIFFPSCWDGVNLDSPDHKSHMSYPSMYNSGFCPPTHPKRFISLFYEVTWETSSFDNQWYEGHQPFVLAQGDDTGYGYHGDFINGWDVPTLQQAIEQCTDPDGKIENCPVFKFFDDDTSNACKIPPLVNEAITGLLDHLPGCNPVQSGPEMANSAAGCGAPTTLGTSEYIFTDLTTSKGFEYVGCGIDAISGQPRTLVGDSITQPDMSVEKCVDYCIGKGFSIAGVEYGQECYCSNTLTANRGPNPKLMGNCAMPCYGNDKETCGGRGAISIYRKCSGTCHNYQFTDFNNNTFAAGSTSYVYTIGTATSGVTAGGYQAVSSSANLSVITTRPMTPTVLDTPGQNAPSTEQGGNYNVHDIITAGPVATTPAIASNVGFNGSDAIQTVTVSTTVFVYSCPHVLETVTISIMAAATTTSLETISSAATSSDPNIFSVITPDSVSTTATPSLLYASISPPTINNEGSTQSHTSGYRHSRVHGTARQRH